LRLEGIFLRKLFLLARPIIFAALVSAVAVTAQKDAAPPAAPVPSAILSSQKIFISNCGADPRLFAGSRAFKQWGISGNTNRPYDQFYAALKATGHYKLVDDPTDADVVLELSFYLPPQVVAIDEGYPDPLLQLVIYDRKTHYVLWTLTNTLEFASTEKNRERNFSDAILAVAAQFDQLTGKQAAAH
jgi:hypothetical protein